MSSSEDKCEVSKDKHEDRRKMEYFRKAINSTEGRKGKRKPPLGGVYKDAERMRDLWESYVRNSAGKTTPAATAPMANAYANTIVLEKIENLAAIFATGSATKRALDFSV
ncbi:hypothetical protein F2Q68_00039796 [Brassica cretica]|uniref:Uncharacterized protein n=1 Tax=Brassica cretica TaxID=69181 RepID=A0A8S9MCY7_BRACR|nr:hypothetical protein F2Q68_00039796 [Brassica cretica]